MKRALGVGLLIMGIAGCLQAAESVAIYQVMDMMGQSEYQILNKADLAKLDAEIKEEAKIFPGVMAASKKEWDANKDNKGPFPAARVKLRSYKKQGSDFASKDLANKRLSQLEDRASDKVIAAEKSKGKGKSNPEEETKALAKARIVADVVASVTAKMGEKLGRPVPSFGFMTPDEPKAKKAGK